MPQTQDIVAKLWNLCNVLKDDGVTYHQYVTELTYLLFLKMAEEQAQRTRYPKAIAGKTTKAKAHRIASSSTRSRLFTLGLTAHLTKEIFANASSFIKKPATLSTLVSEKSIRLTGIPRVRKD